MANKLLLALLVIAGACVIAWSGYKFGRHLAGKDAVPAISTTDGRRLG